MKEEIPPCRRLAPVLELATVKHGKKRWADKNAENAINISHWDRLVEQNSISFCLFGIPSTSWRQ
jgi:hypothetical protein